MVSEILQDLTDGQLVKVFWTDSTGEERIKKGRVTGVAEGFLKLQTHHSTYLVSFDAITSIKLMKGGK